jgi:hypothetical protein
MGGRADLLATIIVFGVAVWLIACSDRDSVKERTERPEGDFDSPYSGQELADKIQAAIDAQGAYTLVVQQSNFVLPQWGGSDGGFVTVGRDGDVSATATLERTGDGSYELWFRDGQTYFKRSTCRQIARVPGGGAEVLEPFVFLGNDRIRQATNLRAASGRTALMLTIEGLGDAEIGFIPGTFLPNQLSSRAATNNGQPLVWTFEHWGQQPRIVPAASEFSGAYDRGPGGNPC